MATLIPFTFQQTRYAWPFIQPAFVDYLSRHEEDWMSEDVFKALICGEAYLWATEDFASFVILQVLQNVSGNELFIWFAHNGGDETRFEHWEQLQSIMESAECSQISWISDREWGRALPELKCRKHYTWKPSE